MQHLLNFRYFLLLLFVVSCGESTSKQAQANTSTRTDSISTDLKTPTPKTILFFGNSLTAGYGLDTQEAFPALIQDRLDSLDLNYTTINSGISGETTSGGLNRIDWVLEQEVDIFVLELGANDGLRGVPVDKTKENLQAIIDKVAEKNANTKIILAGMQIPPNMGQQYASNFKAIFPALAKKNDIAIIPFLLEGVAGIKQLNQKDGIHPTADGQKIVRDNVWVVLKQVIQKQH